MKLEQKSITFDVKASAKTNEIEGYASTFDLKPDSYGDVVAPGAFAQTIEERGHKILLLFNHDWDKILGRVTHLREDKRGLFFKAEITETALGKDVMALIRSSVLTKLSIGYKTERAGYDQERNCRVLYNVTLFEISVVALPANENARLTGFKSNTAVAIDTLESLIHQRSNHKKSNEYKDALDTVDSLLKARKARKK